MDSLSVWLLDLQHNFSALEHLAFVISNQAIGHPDSRSSNDLSCLFSLKAGELLSTHYYLSQFLIINMILYYTSQIASASLESSEWWSERSSRKRTVMKVRKKAGEYTYHLTIHISLPTVHLRECLYSSYSGWCKYIDNLLGVRFRSSLEWNSLNYDSAFSIFFVPHPILASKRLYAWMSL